MAYSSSLNIGLDQIPPESDPVLFNALFKPYNAIHLLAQVTTDLINQDDPPESEWPNVDPAVSARFRNFIYVPVSRWTANPDDSVITPGTLISFREAIGNNGIVPWGVGLYDNFLVPYGVALSEGGTGVWVKVGVLGTVVNIPGITFGMYCRGLAGFGMLTPYSGEPGMQMIAGVGIKEDRFLYYPQFVNVPNSYTSE